MKLCKIIIVTHNSQAFIQWLLNGLETSSNIYDIQIIDSGSTDNSYLDNLRTKHILEVCLRDNIGFVAANNLCLSNVDDYNFVLFLNPDARIEGKDLDNMILKYKDSVNIGIVSGRLIRYDINKFKSLNVYDSRGIKCSLLGKWYDIDSNSPIEEELRVREVEAICGAFMLVNSQAIIKSLNKEDQMGFENNYYMYKEDIEISLRLRRNGFINLIDENYNVFHCRGWKERRNISYWAKFYSARNDIDVALRYKLRAIPFSFFKFLYVITFERKLK